MARSVWKGPFVDLHLMKKVEGAQAGDKGQNHKPDPDAPAGISLSLSLHSFPLITIGRNALHGARLKQRLC
mgnify:CR=1 FL=1